MSEHHDETEVGVCPTCGPTKTERHPRAADVIRCVNCKEWLPTGCCSGAGGRGPDLAAEGDAAIASAEAAEAELADLAVRHDIALAALATRVAPLTRAEFELLARAVHSERGFYVIRDAVNDILEGRGKA